MTIMFLELVNRCIFKWIFIISTNENFGKGLSRLFNFSFKHSIEFSRRLLRLKVSLLKFLKAFVSLRKRVFNLFFMNRYVTNIVPRNTKRVRIQEQRISKIVFTSVISIIYVTRAELWNNRNLKNEPFILWKFPCRWSPLIWKMSFLEGIVGFCLTNELRWRSVESIESNEHLDCGIMLDRNPRDFLLHHWKFQQ